jgi:rRNA maturation protein Nop10
MVIVTTCPRCARPTRADWQMCPHCGQPLTAASPDTFADSPVIRLACPSCGGHLAVPPGQTEYIHCPYCQSALFLRRSSSGASLEMARQMGSAMGREVGQQLRAELREDRAAQRAAAQHQRARRAAVSGSNECRGMFIGCLGAYGLILGFSQGLAASALGLVLLAGAALSAVLTLVFDVKSGWSLTRSLILLLLTAALALGGPFGIVWYFTNVLAHDPNLLRFPAPPTPPR